MFQTGTAPHGRQCGQSDPTGEPTMSESDSHSTDLQSEGYFTEEKILDTTGIVQMLHAFKQS